MNKRVFIIICLFASITARAKDNWPVFYNAEKDDSHLLISREGQTLDAYTLEIPSWNIELVTPPGSAKIKSAQLKELGEVGGLRVVEAKISLTDIYYTDMVMVLKEVKRGRFLPVYVQVYNQGVRWPSDTSVAKDKTGLIINTGMDYDGTGHFHGRYKITLSPNHDPVVTGTDN